MPEALARACTHLGCGNTMPCQTHTREREHRRGTAYQRGYGPRWQRESRVHLKRYPLCGMRPGKLAPVMSRCHEQGLVTAARQVDHVVPHRGDQRLFWDRVRNWQSLCGSCGSRKSQAGL
jgi:5-methylcytosine-specific restriction enzyme A